mgnify:CR=1 FL=1
MNLPPGVSVNDPQAPWNIPAAVFTQWEHEFNGTCTCCDKSAVHINEDHLCEDCFVEEEIDPDDDSSYCGDEGDYLEDLF